MMRDGIAHDAVAVNHGLVKVDPGKLRTARVLPRSANPAVRLKTNGLKIALSSASSLGRLQSP